MSLDLDDLYLLGNGSKLLSYADWALANDLWNGRSVTTLDEANRLRAEIEERLLDALLAEDSPAAQKISLALAWLSTDPAEHSLLQREIEELKFEDGAELIGFRKSTKKFWKKHKTEILIGAGVLALVTVVVVVTVCSGGTAAGAAAAAGSAALDGINQKELDKEMEKKQAAQNTAPQPASDEW